MPERPLPLFPEPDTEPFWAATADHRLTYQVCTHCGQVVFHPRRHCTGCTEGEPEWRGHRAPRPAAAVTGSPPPAQRPPPPRVPLLPSPVAPAPRPPPV